MKLDLDSLKSEILEYLSKEGLIVFHAYSRRLDDVPAVAWDSERYADFRLFLETAKKAGAELIVFHHREFTGTYVDHALAVLEDTELEPDDRRRIERRLRELKDYASFTCAIELSYDYQERLYIFTLETDWYRDYEALRDEIDETIPEGDYEDDEGPVGGYYSRN